MKNKNITKIIAIILAVLMLLSIIMIALNVFVAGAAPTQAEIDRLRAEKREYERRKQAIQSEINTIDFERKTEVAKKSVLDQRIMLTEQEIDNLNETIATYGVLIGEKELEVLAAQSREDLQLSLFKTRVRDMEENGLVTYLDILFDSTSFSDLLARLDFVGDIMQADESTYNNLIKACEDTIAAKDALQVTKLEMEEEKVQLENKQVELAEEVDSANLLIAELEADIEAENALYLEVDAEEKRIQADINKKVEELRREQERQEMARANVVKGSGKLRWPVPSGGSITSEFGTRLHPVYKVYRQHSGIDIGAPHGASIVAADAGTVITSAYNSSYGNYVVISHGNGMTTLYAHMSSRKVSEGTSVSKGQLIGLVGSTGVSTGAHLHFEVSVNGQRVNPRRYL